MPLTSTVIAGVPAMPMKSSWFYGTGVDFSNNVNAWTLSVARAVPFQVLKPCTLAEIGLNLNQAGDAGSVFRVGLFSDNDGSVGTILEQGTIDGTLANYQKFTSSYQLVPGVVYWAAVVWQGGTSTSPSCVSCARGIPYIGVPSTPGNTSNNVSLSFTAAGAFTSNPTITASGGFGPKVWLKAA